MSTHLEELTCKLDKEIICNGPVEIINGKLIRYRSQRETRLIAIMDKDSTLICNGIEYQVHVWGSEKYIIWLLRKGLSKCIVLRNVFLDKCNDTLHAISSAPYSCSKLQELDQCEKQMVEVFKKTGTPLFIAMDEVDRDAKELSNIIIHEDLNDCWFKLLLAKNRYSLTQG